MNFINENEKVMYEFIQKRIPEIRKQENQNKMYTIDLGDDFILYDDKTDWICVGNVWIPFVKNHPYSGGYWATHSKRVSEVCESIKKL